MLNQDRNIMTLNQHIMMLLLIYQNSISQMSQILNSPLYLILLSLYSYQQSHLSHLINLSIISLMSSHIHQLHSPSYLLMLLQPSLNLYPLNPLYNLIILQHHLIPFILLIISYPHHLSFSNICLFIPYIMILHSIKMNFYSNSKSKLVISLISSLLHIPILFLPNFSFFIQQINQHL